jgi:hypothetical protein
MNDISCENNYYLKELMKNLKIDHYECFITHYKVLNDIMNDKSFVKFMNSLI